MCWFRIMSKLEIIDQALLLQVAQAGAAAPRRRRNFNFHGGDDDACHRLLNAVEPDSYIPPHCHLDASKDETILVLRGKFGLVLFLPDGEIISTFVLEAGGESLGANIPHGQFHTLVALAPGSVFFESKAGPFAPLSIKERAEWAPAEGSDEAPAYLSKLKELFVTK